MDQQSFSDGETITSSGTGSLRLLLTTTATGSAAQIKEGVYYINGFHVQVSAQTLILEKYYDTSYRVVYQ